MRNSLKFWLDIKPHPQERIRISFRRRQARAYYPEKTVEFQSAIREMTREYMEEFGIPEYPKGVPLYLNVVFYLLRPKSAKRDYPTVRPDLSNYIKSLEDGMQRRSKNDDPSLIEDDSCIVRMVAEKRYVDDEHPEPGILVEIGQYDG